ncbi:4a-hydroxytetrahydrobiopterin dehydratase [Gilvimarinus polysaccharolyticus]|uniref:4a-hydroxytetrahydrobiopterin dehydratase n=1 Tax=Gilvimarinus polysaccharolyticus TaxID=863921 RepID=UPI000673974E|nr:4a-hydroxytetrahydrobiopterin dehydratase [Gilvimarinus polysaccharolyticus]
MSVLHEQTCSACHADAPKLTEKEIKQHLNHVPEWTVKYIESIPVLTRVFEFKDFAQALSFTNRVGELAEQEQHHPKIVTEWGKVSVDWWTHKIKGLHTNDFIMAAKTSLL